MTSSGSNLGKVTNSRPTADAWCVLEWDSNLKPNIVDSVGISSAAWVQTGVVRVTFTNPERFESGAYVVLGQSELGNAGGYGNVTPQGSVTSPSSTAVGLSGSCDISLIGFNIDSVSAPTYRTDTALNLRHRVNLAFFCLRSDNDIGKTGVINYGTDTANMSVIAPSGSSGGIVLIPGAGIAPDGTQTAVGVRVTANSLGTRKVVQYWIPNNFKTDLKAWNGSIYVKAGDAGRVLRGASANVVFRDNSIGTSPAIRLNLESGVTAFGSASNYVSHNVVPVGNGWYRVSLSNKSGPNEQGQNPGNRNFYMGLLSNFSTSSSNETNWSGNGSIEMYIWGFQMEEGSVTTPYIPASYPLTTTNLLNGIYPSITNNPPSFIITGGEESVNIPALGTVVSKYTDIYNDHPTSGNCCPAPFRYTAPQIAISPNTTYTFSLIYKTENGYTHPNFMYRYEYNSAGTKTIEGGIHSTQNRVSLGNGWWYAWGQFTTQSTTATINCYSFYYQYRTQNRFYVYRASLHQGTSIIPFNRVPLPLQTIVGEPNTPVPGNQDLLTVYSPGGGGFGADNRQNLFRYSQDFSNAVWTKTRVGVCAGYVAPDGTTTAFKLHEVEPSGAAPYYKSMRQAPIRFERGNIRQPYTVSIYAKAAERKYIAFNDGGFGTFGSLVVDLENGNVTQNDRGYAVKTQNAGDGWWRVSVLKPLYFDNNDSINNQYIGQSPSFGFSPNLGETLSAPGGIYGPTDPGVSGSGILVWGAQLERGTVLGDYTPTTNTVAGTTYGRTAGDADSALVNIRTRREATAYGTIVVPPRGAPYLENEYGVGGVRSVGTGTYEVVFDPPMDTTSYCVITSNEKETLAPVETGSGAGSVPESAEYNMNMLRRVSGLDDQRKRSAFRVSTLRQRENADNPNLITIPNPTSLTQLPSPIGWNLNAPYDNHASTVVDVASESSLSGVLRNNMRNLSPYWVKCVKQSASNGIVAAGAPSGTPLVSGGIYRIMYYVVCDHPNFVSNSEIFWKSDNDNTSQVLSLGKYTFSDKGSVRLIETVYKSVAGSNSQVLRTTGTLPIGTTFYVTGIDVRRILPFEARPLLTRTERINFMVFGGRAIRGSE